MLFKRGSRCPFTVYKSTVKKIKVKYTRNKIFGVDYVNKAGNQRCEFYHDGFKKIDIPLTGEVDVLPQYKRYERPNTLGARLKAGVCEFCTPTCL